MLHVRSCPLNVILCWSAKGDLFQGDRTKEQGHLLYYSIMIYYFKWPSYGVNDIQYTVHIYSLKFHEFHLCTHL